VLGQERGPGEHQGGDRDHREHPAICDRLAITITSAAMMPQPPIQPAQGPNARAVHVNVVPQWGSALFSSRNA
jgi:hypothetical protein